MKDLDPLKPRDSARTPRSPDSKDSSFYNDVLDLRAITRVGVGILHQAGSSAGTTQPNETSRGGPAIGGLPETSELSPHWLKTMRWAPPHAVSAGVAPAVCTLFAIDRVVLTITGVCHGPG